MPAELRLRIVGGPEAMAALAARGESVRFASKRALSDSIGIVFRKINFNLTGAVLHVQTGRLRQSMQTFMASDGSSATIGTNVEYARIHEFGGTTRPHVIPVPTGRIVGHTLTFSTPGKGRGEIKSKVIKLGGGQMVMRNVHHPGATVPARPYMRPALEDSRQDIEKIFISRLVAALKKRK